MMKSDNINQLQMAKPKRRSTMRPSRQEFWGLVLAGLILSAGVIRGGEAEPDLVFSQPEQEKPSDIRQRAERLFKMGEVETARAEFERAVAAGLNGREHLEALFGLGRCQILQGELWEAFQNLEASFPGELEAEAVSARVKVEFDLAQRLLKLAGQPVPGAVDDKKNLTGWEAASRVFAAIVYNDPLASEAPAALLASGDCLERLGRWPEAEQNYRRLIAAHPDTNEGRLARAALAELLVRHRRESGRADRAAREAAQLLDEAIAGEKPEPAGAGAGLKEKIAAAQQARDEAQAADLIERARFYLRGTERQRKSGLFVLQDAVHKYPQTKAAQEARKLLDQAGVELAAAGEEKKGAPNK